MKHLADINLTPPYWYTRYTGKIWQYTVNAKRNVLIAEMNFQTGGRTILWNHSNPWL